MTRGNNLCLGFKAKVENFEHNSFVFGVLNIGEGTRTLIRTPILCFLFPSRRFWSFGYFEMFVYRYRYLYTFCVRNWLFARVAYSRETAIFLPGESYPNSSLGLDFASSMFYSFKSIPAA